MDENGRDLPGRPIDTSSAPPPELLGILSGDDFDQDALALAEQSAGVGVWSIDLTTGLVRATAQFFRIMGLPPTSDRIAMDVVRSLRHPDDRDRVLAGFRRALDEGTDAYEMEYRIVRPDGQQRWIFGRGRIIRDRDGQPLRYSGIDLDITDRKLAEEALATVREELERMNRALEERVRERTAALEAEAQRRLDAESRLHQAQKMEAVGQLTGGIAHDFNNILQVIHGNLELAKLLLARQADAQRSKDEGERLLKAIDTAQKSSRSASQLVQRLLAFSRQQMLQPSAIDANRLVEDMTEMIARTLGETIHVETRLASDLWPIHADRSQLETALLNLVVNARDAMPRGGRLIIETTNVDSDSNYAADVVPGDYVLLNVSDTGCGIPASVLTKVFEPFFTTKEIGKGSGLGLSMVYGFVNQSGGHVRIRSTVGEGTTVSIYLPRCETDVMVPDVAGSTDAPLPRAVAGEVVLLVEDNDDIRRLSALALEGLGYRVLLAGDARSALKTIESNGERIDLLFADVALPGGMSGSVLADAARALRSGMPVLLTSGNAVAAGAHPGTVASKQLLDKPYTLEDLAASVRNAIDLGASRRGEVK